MASLRGPSGPFAAWPAADQSYAAQTMIAAMHLRGFELSPRNLTLLAEFVIDIHEGRSPSAAAVAEVGRIAERYNVERRIAAACDKP